MSLRIQFLRFEGCPLAHGALVKLEKALAQLGMAPSFPVEHIDVRSPETPENLRRWGSPTILVNGRELTGQTPGDAPGCRIYPSPDGLPDLDQIVNFLINSRGWDAG